MANALVIDDEAAIRETLALGLRAKGYQVTLSGDGTDGISHARSDSYELILVDLGLPDMDGSEVIEAIRSFCEAPMIVLSVRGDEDDKVRALDAGADDYLTKPFSFGELLARIRAVQRRQGLPTADSLIRTPHFELDLQARQASVASKEVRLTPIEWSLCEQLVSKPGQLVTRRQLLQAVWGPGYGSESNYLRVHFANLRHKLEPDPGAPIYFTTEPGIGYRFRPPET
ncbi:MAG: response regulator transcription factor [Microthrixaceae bacterium]|nr:response regulator transcription factor [Microthrixaceae bacterium]